MAKIRKMGWVVVGIQGIVLVLLWLLWPASGRPVQSAGPIQVQIVSVDWVKGGRGSARVLFKNVLGKRFIGTFAAQDFREGRWIDSTVQFSDGRMARSFRAHTESEFEIPLSLRGIQWRVCWRGEQDFNEVGAWRKRLGQWTQSRLFRRMFGIAFEITPHLEVSSEPIHIGKRALRIEEQTFSSDP